MATFFPFRAYRPVPEKVEQIASVPYDVINTAEARALAEGNPLSFLHVVRPEIDLPEGTDEHAPEVYEKGAENLRRFIEGDNFIREDAPSLYVYRLEMGKHAQEGLFGCVSVAEYDDDTILKHEKTRQDKEDDRTRHILTQQAHAEPVMMTYRGRPVIDRQIAEAKKQAPVYDFVAEDGVRHTLWKVANPGALVEAFEGVEKLYIADGHHRCKASSRAAEDKRAKGSDSGEYAYFPAVLFAMDQMNILPYNRVIRRMAHSPEDFLARLEQDLEVERDVDRAIPDEPGTVCLYLDGRWHRVRLPGSGTDSPVDRLDVSRLSEYVLAPVLGIEDVRRDPNIDFVGGIRGTKALEKMVDEGAAVLAITMYPTSIQDLVDVSDEGLLMPPKSTWFEPKLRSGLLVHVF